MAKLLFNEGILEIADRDAIKTIANINNWSEDRAEDFFSKEKIVPIKSEINSNLSHYGSDGKLTVSKHFDKRICVLINSNFMG